MFQEMSRGKEGFAEHSPGHTTFVVERPSVDLNYYRDVRAARNDWEAVRGRLYGIDLCTNSSTLIIYSCVWS